MKIQRRCPSLVYLFVLFASLSAAEIEIGGAQLAVEIADDPESRRIGLSGRTELADDRGMLFIFEKPQVLAFWMKDTFIPLSIGFFDVNRVLLQVEEMDPPIQKTDKLSIYKSKRAALYALETPQGWFERNKIKPGMKFELREALSKKNPFPDQANPIK